MIIDSNFNNNGNNFKSFQTSNQNMSNGLVTPRTLHSNQGNLTENSMLTENISSFSHTDPSNSQAMGDKAVAMLYERYKNKSISTEDFNKQCANIAKNRQ